LQSVPREWLRRTLCSGVVAYPYPLPFFPFEIIELGARYWA
jgi:hypothetical protein